VNTPAGDQPDARRPAVKGASMKDYRNPLIRKQVSIYLPAAEWRTLRDESVRRGVPMAELCRRCLGPGLERLRNAPEPDPADDPRRPPGGKRGSRRKE
jgi:hypothetical protein